MWSVQIRFPAATSDEEAVFIGLYSAFERLEAFQPDAVSLQPRFHATRELTNGLMLRFSAGPSIVVTADGRAWEDPESYLVYEPQLEYGRGNTTVAGQLSGRYLFTQRDLSFSQRSHHHFTLSVTNQLHHWTPGLFLRIPLDRDVRELLDFAAGFTLAFEFF